MKLSTALEIAQTNQITVTGAQRQQNARLNLGPEIFNILSRLYARPEEAVLRELLCNAYDSHITAGKGDVPITLFLPTRFSNMITIEDTGLGLSVSEVFDLYTVYGLSTKKDEVATIGRFGMGSKSFFAVTDQATITARKNGIEAMFSFTKDQNGLPVIIQVSETPTSQPNGLIISFPVREGSRETWIKAAETVLARWPDPSPRLPGYEQHEWNTVQYYMRLPRVGIRDHRSSKTFRPQGSYAIMGTVAYPINWNQVPGVVTHNINMDLFFNLGELLVSPSRESLEYTPAVREVLKAAHEEAIKELIGYYDKQAGAAAPSSLDEALKAASERGTLFEQVTTSVRDLLFKHKVSYDYKRFRIPASLRTYAPNEYVGTIAYDFGNVETLEFWMGHNNKTHGLSSLGDNREAAMTGWRIGYVDMPLDRRLDKTKRFYICSEDDKQRKLRLFNKLVTAGANNISGAITRLVVGPVTKEFIDDMKELYPQVEFVDLKNVEPAKPLASASGKRTKFDVIDVTRSGGNCWHEKDIDLNEGGHYWEYYKTKPVTEHIVTAAFQFLSYLKVDHGVEKIIAVPKTRMSQLKGTNKPWVDVMPYLQRLLTQNAGKVSTYLANYADREKVYRWVDAARRAGKHWDDLPDTHPLRRFYQDWIDTVEETKLGPCGVGSDFPLDVFYGRFNLTTPVASKPTRNLFTRHTGLVKRYPLLFRIYCDYQEWRDLQPELKEWVDSKVKTLF